MGVDAVFIVTASSLKKYFLQDGNEYINFVCFNDRVCLGYSKELWLYR